MNGYITYDAKKEKEKPTPIGIRKIIPMVENEKKKNRPNAYLRAHLIIRVFLFDEKKEKAESIAAKKKNFFLEKSLDTHANSSNKFIYFLV